MIIWTVDHVSTSWTPWQRQLRSWKLRSIQWIPYTLVEKESDCCGQDSEKLVMHFMMNAWRHLMSSRIIYSCMHSIVHLIWVLLNNLSLIINIPETVLQIWNWFEVTWWWCSISRQIAFLMIWRTWSSSMNILLWGVCIAVRRLMLGKLQPCV